MGKTGPKSSSCLVTREDIPRVLASFVVYGACACYGACCGVLGPAIPVLAEKLHVLPTVLGELFAYRGGGYFFGALFCSWFLNKFDGKDILSKQVLVFFSVGLSGLATMFLSLASSMGVIRALFAVQGLGFSGVDTFGAIAVSEMWGQRMQPWMQAKSLVFSLSSIFGPFVINTFSLNMSFLLCGLLASCSLFALLAEYVYAHSSEHAREDIGSIEAAYSPHSHESNESDGEFKPLSRSETFLSNVFEATAPIPPAELLSHELTEIENTLDHEKDVGLERTKSMISDILHKPEVPSSYICNPGRSAGHDDDSELFPINRTLSFATPKIVDMIEEMPKQFSITLVPVSVQRLLALQMLVFVGLYYSYAGWIPTYATMSGIASRPEDASYLAGIYYTTCSIGSAISVVMAMSFSTTFMMRLSLSLVTLGCCCLLVLPHTLNCTAVTSAILGFAVSGTYPLILAISNDYSLTMNGAATSVIILGGTIGESCIPALVGILLQDFGQESFSLCYMSMCAVIVLVYLIVHHELSKYTPVAEEQRVPASHEKQPLLEMKKSQFYS